MPIALAQYLIRELPSDELKTPKDNPRRAEKLIAEMFRLDPTLELDVKAQKELEDAAPLVHDYLKNLSYLGTAEALNKLDAFTEIFLEPLRLHLKAYLDASYPDEEDKEARQWVEKQILNEYLFAVIKQLPKDHDVSLSTALVSAFNSLGLPQKNRMDQIRDKLPERSTVSPTVCYYSGKRGLTYFGHVALAIRTDQVPHDLIETGPLPPFHDAIDRWEYLNKLPIDPHHNAIVDQGYSYSLVYLKLDLPPENLTTTPLPAEIKDVIQRKDHQGSHILIRNGEKDLYLLHSPNPPKRELKQIEENSPEYKTLMELHHNIYPSIPDPIDALASKAIYSSQPDDPALQEARVLEAMLSLTPKTMKKNIWYLRRKDVTEREDNDMRDQFHVTILDDSPEYDAFKQSCVTKSPAAAGPEEKKVVREENGYCLAQLSPMQVSEFRKLSDKVPYYSAYLSYGADHSRSLFGRMKDRLFRPKKHVNAGIGDDARVTVEKTIYLKKSAEVEELELPPQSWNRYEHARTEFAIENKRNYSIQYNNCAHAVKRFLRTMTYLDSKTEIATSFYRPSNCASDACDIQMNEVNRKREAALANQQLHPAEKVCALLQFEIDRLTIQIKQDQIRHLDPGITVNTSSLTGRIKRKIWKDPAIKEAKIAKLNELLTRFKTLDQSGGPVSSADLKAIQDVIVEMRRKNPSKNTTADHLQACLDACTPQPQIEVKAETEVKEEMKISLHSHQDGEARERSRVINKPTTQALENWVSVSNHPETQYYYSNTNEEKARKMLRESMNAVSAPSSSALPLDSVPPLSGTLVRMSQHELRSDPSAPSASPPLRFGLVEKSLNQGQELRSELIPPRENLDSQRWLLLVDRQITEGCKALGKESRAITIHTLEYKDLQTEQRARETANPGAAAQTALPSLQPFEAAYIHYCLAMNIACQVKHEGKEVPLSRAFLQKIAPCDPAAVKQTIEKGRTPEPEPEPAAMRFRVS